MPILMALKIGCNSMYVIVRYISCLPYYYNEDQLVWYGIINNATKYETKQLAVKAAKNFKFLVDYRKVK
jgi:hypothetical protein